MMMKSHIKNNHQVFIAVVGSVAAGKSNVCKMLENAGCEYLDLENFKNSFVSENYLHIKNKIYNEISLEHSYYDVLNKLFDIEKINLLNNIALEYLFYKNKSDNKFIIHEVSVNRYPSIVMDFPRTSLNKKYNEIVYVKCSEKRIIQRMRNRNLSDLEIKDRIDIRPTDRQFSSLSTIKIDNDSDSIIDLNNKFDIMWDELEKKYSRSEPKIGP